MSNKKIFVIALFCLFLNACCVIEGVCLKIGEFFEDTGEKISAFYDENIASKFPSCQHKTTVTVNDEEGTYQVPGCMDYTPQFYGYATTADKATLAETDYLAFQKTQNSEEYRRLLTEYYEEAAAREQKEGDYGDYGFPEIYTDKYINQVVLQNLQTRVLAYCRGSDKQIDDCVSRLECAGYRRITDVPYMSGKYDALQKGTYPTRRWRENENVSRW